MQRIRIHKPRPTERRFGGHGCDHRAVLPSRTSPGTGRCLECGATVSTPAWLHPSA